MKCCIPILVLLGALSLPAKAARPTEEVKGTADRLIGILTDPNLQGDANKAERRRLILKELDDRFDWPAIARGCLGRNWTKRSRPEQQEFVALFRRLLERTYVDKLEPYYTELDKIAYQGEKIVGTYASVRTVITTKRKLDHPVEYRLEQSGDRWRVYDVVIEGVSMVKNYRVQFDEVISRSSYEGLIKDLRAKVEANAP